MLKKIQAVSGIVFVVFVVVHLLNTWLAALGPDAYDGFQNVARPFYQHILVEALILGALIVHVIVGVTRIVIEPKRDLSARAKWHRYAGFFLMTFIGGHIFAVRGPSWFLDIIPGFSGLAFSIDYAPYYFFPYYFLLAVAGFYHGANGLSIAVTRLGTNLSFRTGSLQAATVGASALTIAALLGFAGVWTDIGDPYSSEFAQLAFRLLDDFSS